MGEINARTPENAWKCSNCGYGLQAPTPPAACPSCGKRCEFLNVTCYTPDCAETGADPRLKPAK